jgi:hypothetical protein
MREDQILQLKTHFAMALLKNNDPYAAAFAVFPSEEVSMASEASRRWPLDKFVMSEMERLKKEGFGIDNVDKDTQAYDIYKIASDDQVDVEFRLKAHDLYAKIRGHIERPAVNNGIINNSNKVMVIRMPTHNDGTAYSEEEWEQQSSLAQKTLQGT